MNIKLGLISDFHAERDSWSESRTLIESLLEVFEEQSVDLIVDLGDRIQEKSEEDDIKLTALIHETLANKGHRIAHLHGNHDVIYAEKATLNHVLQKSNDYESFLINGYLVILLDTTYPESTNLSKKQIEWLKQELLRSHPKILFSHHPIYQADVTNHPYLAKHLDESVVRNAALIHNLLHKSQGICAIFQGHLHITAINTLEDIPLRIVPPMRHSVDQRFPFGGIAIVEFNQTSFKESYYALKLSNEKIDFQPVALK